VAQDKTVFGRAHEQWRTRLLKAEAGMSNLKAVLDTAYQSRGTSRHGLIKAQVGTAHQSRGGHGLIKVKVGLSKRGVHGSSKQRCPPLTVFKSSLGRAHQSRGGHCFTKKRKVRRKLL
jgi:hypothetical protein